MGLYNNLNQLPRPTLPFYSHIYAACLVGGRLCLFTLFPSKYNKTTMTSWMHNTEKKQNELHTVDINESLTGSALLIGF